MPSLRSVELPNRAWNSLTKVAQTIPGALYSMGYQGWGLLRQFLPFRYFPIFLALSKHTLDIEYYVYIWRVSPQLSCGDTCQIWMWFKESNSYLCKIENFACGEINERSFSNPHPCSTLAKSSLYMACYISTLVQSFWNDCCTMSNRISRHYVTL